MVKISTPLSTAKVRTYYLCDFTNARENYFNRAERVNGRWHGQLAQAWGLKGDVSDTEVHRLADGRHPVTNDLLVPHRRPQQYLTRQGLWATSMSHRAAWDLTFSAPKSVSLTALVGGDARVMTAHRASALVTLGELERYVQVLYGRRGETTGNWVAALFEHDSARPVDGYAAPQLHLHVVIFNVSRRSDGVSRALHPIQLLRSVEFATAVYRSELARRLSALGYGIDRGRSGQPEIRGYSDEYLAASSPRRRQIAEYLRSLDSPDRPATRVAVFKSREAKCELSREEMAGKHRHLAAKFGDQPARVIEAASRRGARIEADCERSALSAVASAARQIFEHEAAIDERFLIRDALTLSMGAAGLGEVREAIGRWVAEGRLVRTAGWPSDVTPTYTTPEMLSLDARLVASMRAGLHAHAPVAPAARLDLDEARDRLSGAPERAARDALLSRDQFIALECGPGADRDKKKAIGVIRDMAARAGYEVVGLARTPRVGRLLAEAGLNIRALQDGATENAATPPKTPRLYVLDESRFVNTLQLHRLVERLQPHDRVLMVDDGRGGSMVRAGRPYRLLQRAGMAAVQLNGLRAANAHRELASVAEELPQGSRRMDLDSLHRQGCVYEIGDRSRRLAAIARAVGRDPFNTVVVSLDPHARRDLNAAIRTSLQQVGLVDRIDRPLRVLVAPQDVAGAERFARRSVQAGDVVLFTTRASGRSWAERVYARVESVDPAANRLTLSRAPGDQVIQDLRDRSGVTLYCEVPRMFAVGDRVQFTAPRPDWGITGGELGTVLHVDKGGHVQVRRDSGRRSSFALNDYPHIDHGYAVAGGISPWPRVDRVVFEVDTTAGVRFVDRRFGDLTLAGAPRDVQIYTDSLARLVEILGREPDGRSTCERRRGPQISVGAALSQGL
jgi:conjugative relaxase-like TrwC/TraI family protein